MSEERKPQSRQEQSGRPVPLTEMGGDGQRKIWNRTLDRDSYCPMRAQNSIEVVRQIWGNEDSNDS